jgi:exportin-1
MLKSFAGSDVATQFHQAYYLQLLREVLAVMTDTFHTPGFKLHCRILLHLFGIVRDEAVIKAPLWDVAVRGPLHFAQIAERAWLQLVAGSLVFVLLAALLLL